MAQRTQTSQASGEQWVWALVIVALWGLFPVPPTLCMLLICASMFLLIKSHSMVLFSTKHRFPGLLESVQWYLWVGLKPESFFIKAKTAKSSQSHEYLLASIKVLVGIGLVVASTSMTSSPILAAWTLWVGFGFLLHFGLFHIHALFLRSQGRNVVPIMNAPLVASSVSEFWGKRWNLAFRDYAYRTLFKPMSKRFSPHIATMIGFFFSGLIHEIAISVPAGGGFGFPMLYFLLQGVGLIVERKFKHLKTGWRGHLWTFACVLIPAPLLFHSKFMSSVVFTIVQFFASIPNQ